MNEILGKIARLVQDPSLEVDMTGFLFALVVSAFVGVAVSALYQVFYENRATGSQIHRSFLLISPSITALFIAIQFSLPLSLGLLGALSIIRFRTPIKEPEEVGFIMLLIACSVVCATFQFMLLLVLLLLALAVLTLQRYVPGWFHSKRTDGILLLTLNGDVAPESKEKLVGHLKEKLTRGRLQGITYAENLTTIHFSFNGMDGAKLDGLHKALHDIAPIQRLNIYFNSQGALT
ncbi:MAG: hypothetical protein JWO30_2922 [Fibrobacteres bacterium]|nr:hypothetical protein [Fibrobacterota bacterium]